MKSCRDCAEVFDNLPIRQIRCKSCMSIHNKKLRQTQRYNVLSEIARGKPLCNCCGECLIEFLTIDHVGGRGVGSAHRRKEGPSSMDLVKWIRRQKRDGIPIDVEFQILCMNCNTSIGAHGYCPHQTESQFVTDAVSGSNRVTVVQESEIKQLRTQGKSWSAISRIVGRKRSTVCWAFNKNSEVA